METALNKRSFIVSPLHNFLRTIHLFYLVKIKEGLLLRWLQKRFYFLMGGHIFFEALSAGVEFDLFNILQKEKKLTLKAIAQKLGIEEQPCRVLLLPLVTAGVLKKRGEYYQNTSMAKLFLTNEGSWRYLSCIRWQHHINYKPLHSFYEAIQKNKNVGLDHYSGEEPTLYQRLAHEPRLEGIFQSAMQELSLQTHDVLCRYVDFSQTKYVIDVGGGNGTNLIRLLHYYPHLQGSVFDFPSVCEIATQNIQEKGFESKIDAISGNIFEDNFPEGADCILFCHFFTIWSKEQNLQLLKKAFRALPKGGKVIIFNMMQNDDETGPMTAAIGSPYFLTLATGKGMLYTWAEYEALFREAGFQKVVRKMLPRDHGVVVGVRS